ncbi:TetR/AcrR family transcriptional regulator [Actinokineospora fastidiosa]|uniref:TetR family transcriptional regulator n=1 Tax=Actinokineospora fastidiosa TaxID=1816 RepID=A0A918GKL4_9PSEU|nr:TetR/AcrR family transcriptional regulator [Actinokineospora fastidiosa]GGS41508.1 TetR family transcriptional regulator [Actinokineospora fastidiosa]
MPAIRSRREQYSEATRAAILDAATRRFATSGFAATGLEDVAADIQATRGAVYHHFASKKALFEAVLEEQEVIGFRWIERARAAASDPWQGAMAAMEAFLDQCLDPVYSRIVWQEGPIALGWQAWQESEKKYAYAHIAEILAELVGAGLLSPLPEETATHVCFTMLGSAGMALAQADPADQPRLRAEYGDVFRRMLAGLRATG